MLENIKNAFKNIKDSFLRREFEKLSDQINSGEITVAQARQKINKLYSSGKLDFQNARLIDGILFREENTNNAITQKT